MQTIKQLNAEIEDSESIKLVTQALGEIATLQLKSTRDLVLHTTSFFIEIELVYHMIKLVAERRRMLESHMTQKIGKTICILISSNYHFNGNIDYEICQSFIKTTQNHPTDCIIVGKFAQEYFRDAGYNRPYQSMLFAADFPTADEIKQLVDKTHAYQKVLVYHSKFVSVLHQGIQISDISQSDAVLEASSTPIDYILEPELDKMLDFFESQIKISLLQAIFLESELSRTAARMIAMHDAETNAEKIIKEEQRELYKANRSIKNIQILETYAGVRNLLKNMNTKGA